jgi:uncharacterized protein YycO
MKINEIIRESRGHKIIATKLANMDRMKNVQIPTPAERKAQLEKQKKEEPTKEHIGKVKDGYRLYSKKGSKNLGTFPTKAGAEKHEREVQYFKHKGK